MMADIKQAAKWLDEGKRVTAPGMFGHFLFREGHRLRCSDGKRNWQYELSMADLLDERWEIAK